jgi:hemerythrin superfamily protein
LEVSSPPAAGRTVDDLPELTPKEDAMPNAVDLLKKDHRTVESLFAQFESAHDSMIATQICDEIDVHAQAEEQALYPALREEVSRGKQMADHAAKEHAEARQLIGRIRQTKDPGHLADLVAKLKSSIEEHVGEEEGEVFPKMQQELGESRLADIGEDIETVKASA